MDKVVRTNWVAMYESEVITNLFTLLIIKQGVYGPCYGKRRHVEWVWRVALPIPIHFLARKFLSANSTVLTHLVRYTNSASAWKRLRTNKFIWKNWLRILKSTPACAIHQNFKFYVEGFNLKTENYARIEEISHYARVSSGPKTVISHTSWTNSHLAKSNKL